MNDAIETKTMVAEMFWGGYLNWALQNTDLAEADIPRERKLFIAGFMEDEDPDE